MFIIISILPHNLFALILVIKVLKKNTKPPLTYIENCLILKGLKVDNIPIKSTASANNFRQSKLKQLKRQDSQSIRKASQSNTTDSVEISDQSKMLAKLNQSPEIRKEKVQNLKRLAQEQQLLSQEKIRFAIRRMLTLMFS